MGSNIKVEGNTAFIEGVDHLTSANLTAPDLRAGAALVMAYLAAEGFQYSRGISGTSKEATKISGEAAKSWGTDTEGGIREGITEI